MYFAFMYENTIMKSVEIVQRRGKGMREMMEEVNPIKIYCKHMYKCHNVSSPTTITC
jgi:hypothetical protein